MKPLSVAAIVVLLAGTTTLDAQSPKGWMVRADRSTSASDPDAAGAIKFVAAGSGFHATNPQAAVFWQPSNTVTGAYVLKGTFTLLTPSDHANYYGLVFGGSELDGPGQNYLYFLVAQNGTWLIKRRDGDATTQNVVARTASDLVRKPDSTGKSVNLLEVRVGTDKIDYLVNGTIVTTTPRTALTAKTDGIYGIRINHRLDVQVDGFGITKK